MRKVFTLLFLFVVGMANAGTPRWIKKTPQPSNETYYYVVESATATSETSALNKAMGLVMQRSVMSLGLPVSSKQVENAVRTGTLESLSTEFKIPVNRVCVYRCKVDGGVRVYVLCQVATTGNAQVRFSPYNDCGDPGDISEIGVNARPEEWSIYESDKYFSAFVEDEIGKKDVDSDFLIALGEKAAEQLKSEIHLKDSSLISLIERNTYYHKSSHEGFAVAYVPRKSIIDAYTAFLDEEMEVANTIMEQIQSRIEGGDAVNAKASLEMLDERFKELNTHMNFVRAYAASYRIEQMDRNRRDLVQRIAKLKLDVAGNHNEIRVNKVREFVRVGLYAESKYKIGDALRYLYAAQVLAAAIPDYASSKDTLNTPSGHKVVMVDAFIRQHIKDILSNIKVSFDGMMPGSDTEGKMSFLYAYTKNGIQHVESISDLMYTYNDNSGWSDQMAVRDGWSVVPLSASNKPTDLHVRIEYKYEEDASSDPELAEKIRQYSFNYDATALKIIPVNTQTYIDKPVTHAKQSTSITQNSVSKYVCQSSHIVESSDSANLSMLVVRVCDAIMSQNYVSVRKYFSVEGYEQFERLIMYGKARIISSKDFRFVRVGDEIQCRSIPMQFTFRKGKNTIENVVFTFRDNKIDGVQFALEERSARNIMADTRCSETTRLVLVNFLENYKTAFALKRIDYIESIFADDAVIITGRVLQRTASPLIDLNDKIAYPNNMVHYTRHTKGEYIKRLRSSFDSKEWINIKFGSTEVEPSAQGNNFGVCLLQDYSSSNYGDRGYLFLLIDCDNEKAPTIRVRTWQPETAGSRPFNMADYDELTNMGSN